MKGRQDVRPTVHRILDCDLPSSRGDCEVDPILQVIRPAISIVVPAYNEELGLSDTIESLLVQTEKADRVIVVDDCSTDRTREMALGYPGVECLTPPENLGSKARAQNYALEFVETDLLLPVDGDTILSENYLQAIKEPFVQDDNVTIAGCSWDSPGHPASPSSPCWALPVEVRWRGPDYVDPAP